LSKKNFERKKSLKLKENQKKSDFYKQRSMFE
jgi:hypothetical protein